MKYIMFRAFLFFFLISGICCNLAIPKASRAGDPIQLYYSDPAQVELISPKGSRVLIDVCSPERLSSPPTGKDVLLTTHNHGDHRRLDFVKSFPGKQLDMKAGEIKLKDATICSIASAHNEGDEFKKEGGSNYIFIIDMAGFRIAHFGDIGQEALTPEQLKALGKVDIKQFSGVVAENALQVQQSII